MNPVTPGKPIVNAVSYLDNLSVKSLLSTEKDRISTSSVSLDNETIHSIICDSCGFPCIGSSPVVFKKAGF